MSSGLRASGLGGSSARGPISGKLLLASGRHIEYDEAIWCTQVGVRTRQRGTRTGNPRNPPPSHGRQTIQRPTSHHIPALAQGGAAPWLATHTPLELDGAGFVAVHPTLESVSHPGEPSARSCLARVAHNCDAVVVPTSSHNPACMPGIFAAGDVAAVLKYPRPKAGVFAVRQGPPLTKNLRAKLLGKPLEPFEPQSRFLGLIGTGGCATATPPPPLAAAAPAHPPPPSRPAPSPGDGGCVASKGPLCLDAKWLWGLKDWIDRTWMAAYTTGLPTKIGMDNGETSDAAVTRPRSPEFLTGHLHARPLPTRPRSPCSRCQVLRASWQLPRAPRRSMPSRMRPCVAAAAAPRFATLSGVD